MDLVLKEKILKELRGSDNSSLNSHTLMSKYKIGLSSAYEILEEFEKDKKNSTSIKFGYARVSTKDQNEERQLEKFRELGIDERHIFIDKQTGRNFERPKYLALKEVLRQGDTLYILDLKRFGRDYKQNEEQFREITKEIRC